MWQQYRTCGTCAFNCLVVSFLFFSFLFFSFLFFFTVNLHINFSILRQRHIMTSGLLSSVYFHHHSLSLLLSIYSSSSMIFSSFFLFFRFLTLPSLPYPQIGQPSIHADVTGSHSTTHIFPLHFRSTRIFWSMTVPFARTLYIFEVSR